MRIVFLTTADPIYLPAFFERVLDERGTETASVCIVPPLYKGQGRFQAASRYYRTFGLSATLQLARHVVVARVRGRSIATVAARRGVESREVADVNAPEFVDWVSGLRPDLLISVSCPQIFRRSLLDVPAVGALNIHGAVLPSYRGIMPSFWMLANGEREAGVSIYFMNEQIDAGDLCGQRVFPIEDAESLHSFLVRSKAVAAELLLDVLDEFERGSVMRRPLDLTAGSYYSWPDRADVARLHAAGRRLW
jgi:methionyl-tRNA formyltransferase